MRRVTFTEGEFYHLYNRGVDKRVVFTDAAEYKRFIAYLLILNDTEQVRADNMLRGTYSMQDKPQHPLVALGVFCLMPNHFHLYATPLVEGGISKFMQRLQTAYTMYFNEKHERSGSLFQGTFKAEHVGNDQYAKYLFSYIHLNPAKIVDSSWREFGPRDFRKVKEYVSTYPYSSIGEYQSGKHLITDPDPFPRYFSTTKDVEDHIDSWLDVRNQTDLK